MAEPQGPMASEENLGSSYADLSGEALLHALSEGGELRTLEAFWYYGDAAVCAATTDAILISGSDYLVDLLVGELTEPARLGDPFPNTLVEALKNHRPQLQPATAQRLAERVCATEEPYLEPTYESARPLLEIWLTEQEGTLGEDIAIDVIAGRTPQTADNSVREAAFARCRRDSRVLKETADAVLEVFEAEPAAAWARGAELVEKGCGDEKIPPEPIVSVIKQLLHFAPGYAGDSSFTPKLTRFAAVVGVDDLESIFQEDALDRTAGADALMGVVASVEPARAHTRLFVLAVRKQPRLWPALKPHVAEWSEADWKRVLKALVGGEEIDREPLLSLINDAPASALAETMRLALSQARSADDLEVLAPVGDRLARYVEELAEFGADTETRAVWVQAVHWPSARDDDVVAKIYTIIGCLPSDKHARMVSWGLIEGKTSADTAARLLPAEETLSALKLTEGFEVREPFARALVNTHPVAFAAAAVELQTNSYSFDLARALAPTHPELAFTGAAEAFLGLDKSQRDELIALLVTHATRSEIPVLEVIVRHDHRENAERRALAAGRISALSPEGERPPECVTDLLRSNIPKLREAAVRAIETLRPRDPELIGGLHDVAVASGSAAGRAAATALDSLTDDFLTDLEGTPSKDELREVLPLLGVVGRAKVLPALFRHVGRDAEYDDDALHRIAAKAILTASERIKDVSEEDQATLARLLEGEEAEVDVDARGDLSAALANVQLGDDAAVKILYDEIGIKPKTSPDILFGSEKSPLVRHLGLYARARDQGAAGWGMTITQLDNVAERLVRAAYLVVGESEAIKEKIRTDPRQPDYGTLITALSSVKELQAIRDDCGVLHDLRCSHTEVPHPGEQPDNDAMASARTCFKKIGKVCLGTLQQAVGISRSARQS